MWKKFKQAVWPKDETEKYPFENKYVTINDHELLLRKAIPDDLEDLMNIQEQIYGSPAPWTSDIFLQEIRNRSALYLVLSDVDKVVAFIGLAMNMGKESHITNFAISPDHQKFGLGHLLLNQVIDFSRKYDYNRVSLEVDITNDAAIDLYEAFGFETRLVHKKYYYRNHHDALEMVVEL
ncbi:ribosomal protein S18-alanine N-acetyltransferase [Companilactobacillus ginsenosidimutans]|uniref:Alanine acetyltransferase n=1 Tax=Companilactobacillus ginsenosidimutans TaxID=1007676 RepID=A0A0H4QZS7_9LACO|nr:ribosomal protein S18-alanine N-acetyltransferase [Companilactobacillus ginsenosidimutans]AKP66950.1 alanine acetyltransferase [Companilactobacillus ginsenosidimutans]